ISSVSPSLQQISCSNPNIQTVTLTAVSPTNNVIHYVTDGLGNTVVITGSLALFLPSATTNSYTYTMVDAATNCSATPKTFSVMMSSANSLTFDIIGTGTLSNQGNFTVGCTPNHHLTVINIMNVTTNPPGNPVQLQFCFTSPGGSQICGNSQFTVASIPGTWTVGVYDVSSGCLTQIAVPIIQNTIAPNVSINIPTPILGCGTLSTMIMTATATPSNVTYK